MAKILIAEDDQSVRDALSNALDLQGFTVIKAEDGQEALEQVESEQPDLILLDVMMPRLDGIEVCRRLRSQGLLLPILILTAREEAPLGLDAGADDYMTKPYDLDELFARIRALLRRSGLADDVEAGDIRIDNAGRRAWIGQRELELSKTEFDLLELLVRNRGIVLSRETIYQRIWNYDFGPGSKNLNVYINYLRGKLEADGEARVLETVRGVGYVIR